jgi:arginyl-tRNA synthetase
VNFRLDRAALIGHLEATAGAGKPIPNDVGAGQTIVVDYSSPNIAKHLAYHHIRSTVIGQALVNIHRALGYRVVGINHLGDWGTTFGMLLAGQARWGAPEPLTIDALNDLYVRFRKAAKEDPALDDDARAWFKKLEDGDAPARAAWQRFRDVSLAEYQEAYDVLGVKFDAVRGESEYETLMPQTIKLLEDKGLTSISEDALVVDLTEEKMPPCLLRKRDGTTLYATRDLAALFHRWEEFHFERCLYVVGGEQKLHFRQLKGVLKRMQLEWEPRVEHIDFGLLLGPGRVKLASRKGEVLVLDDLVDEVVEEAARILSEKQAGLSPEERVPDTQLAAVAEAVGIGALCFNDQKRERIKDVLFDKAEILSFEGDTGPYVQYTHARFTRILRKVATAGQGGGTPDWALLSEAGPILIQFARFPDVVRSAAERCEPSELAQYLLALCRELNNWYREQRVLDQDAALTASRLALVRASKVVISNGLRLLGLRAPEQM